MDAVTNVLLGIFAGLIVAGWNRSRPAQRLKLILIGVIGATLPSVDEITLWAGFDEYIAPIFQLDTPGHILYFSKVWYGHQGFFHSLLAAALCSLLIGLVLSTWYYYIERGTSTWQAAFRYMGIYMATTALGFCLHLCGDLVAPGGPWEGIRLFYPLDQYVGGWGLTWWWNNYDLDLIILLSISICAIFLHTAHPLKKGFRMMPTLVLGCCMLTISWQLSQRSFDFNVDSYVAREAASKHIQRQVLGESVTQWMEWIDRRLPVYF